MSATKIRVVSGEIKRVPKGLDPEFDIDHEPTEFVLEVEIKKLPGTSDRSTVDYSYQATIIDRPQLETTHEFHFETPSEAVIK